VWSAHNDPRDGISRTQTHRRRFPTSGHARRAPPARKNPLLQILVGATETAGRPSEEATYCLQAQADRLSLVVALGRIVIATIW
jgi:hypothetical protein